MVPSSVCPILVPQGKSPLNGPKRDQFFSKQGPKRDQFLLKKGPFRPQTITTKSPRHFSKGVGEAGGLWKLFFFLPKARKTSMAKSMKRHTCEGVCLYEK